MIICISVGGDVRKLLFSELIHDDVISICYANSEEVAFEIRFLIDFGADGTDYSLKIDLSQISELNIGDKSSANIELSTEYRKRYVCFNCTYKQWDRTIKKKF